MTNWHVEDRLNAYLANEVDAQEKDFIESHLEICQTCRNELEFLRKLDQQLDQLPLEDPGPDFADAVMSRVVQRKRKNFWGTDLRNMVASAVAAFVLFQGFSGILPKMAEMDSTITAYTVIAKVKFEIWVELLNQTIR